MPTKHSRVNVVLEKPLYAMVDEIAKRQGLSKSMVVRDLVREAIQLREDLALAAFAQHREDSFEAGKALSHEDAWG